MVAVNERGRRIGETHHNALISDAVVDLMRDRHEDDGVGYRKISREFNVALTTVRKICTYERRAQTAERWKTIKVRKPKPAVLAELFDRPNEQIKHTGYIESYPPSAACASDLSTNPTGRRGASWRPQRYP